MRKVQVGVDVDEVLYPFLAAFAELAWDNWDLPMDPAKVTQWDFHRQFWGKDDKWMEYAIRDLAEKGLYDHAGAFPDVAQALRDFKASPAGSRCDIHVVTARGTDARVVSDTVSWLEWESIPYGRITFAGEGKGGLGLDFHLDDHPEFLTGDVATLPVLLSRPWNAHAKGVFRADTVRGYLGLVADEIGEL